MAKRKTQPRNLVNELRRMFPDGVNPDGAGEGVFITPLRGFWALIQTDETGAVIGGMAIANEALPRFTELLAEATKLDVPENVAEAHNAG